MKPQAVADRDELNIELSEIEEISHESSERSSNNSAANKIPG